MATGAIKLSVSNSETDEAPKPPTGPESYKFWQEELDASERRLRKFRKQGNQIVDRYIDYRGSAEPGDPTSSGEEFRLNLFYTNVTTLMCMLYGSTPKIDVAREHHDPDDDTARVASMLLQRILESDVSSSGNDLPTTLKAALQDRLLPGLGVARVHYGFETEEVDSEKYDEDYNGESEDEEVTKEWCRSSYVHWQDFSWGWGRTWSEVPWVGFRSYLCKDEAIERFGQALADKLEYKQQVPTGDDKDAGTGKDEKSKVHKAEIWELWNKPDHKVYWYSPGVDVILDVKDDPLELSGFFPCPMPLMANLTTTNFVPRADFVIAQDLYNEIDTLQTRISIITRALKVVGVYNQSAGDSVGRMLIDGKENQLIPVENWAMFTDSGGLKGNLEWFPIEDVVSALNELVGIRDQTIELLYQVTGMSDILRGANTDQYTSDGTNQLKAKFGSIRIQALQDQFATFASDLEALKAEVISKHFNSKSIVFQSNANFVPQADQPRVPNAIQLIMSPDIRWRVNIRPESIAMVDYAQLKSERTEYLTAMATFIQSGASAVEAVPGSLPILLEMMKWAMAGFKESKYLEGTFDSAIDMAKKAPIPDPNAQQNAQDQMKMQIEQMKHQNEMEKMQASHQMEMQALEAKLSAKMQEITAKSQLDIKKILADFQADLKIIMANQQSDLAVESAQAQGEGASAQVEHENNLDEMTVQHEYKMEELGAAHEAAMVQKEEDAKNAEVEARRKDTGTDSD